ncbi:hypothetical protein [Streptomyces avermitilis]|uniref:hypothetical protein n=1 Tax=Streptomyces avermitilis TaxID=33903 RepID=UPI003F5381F9
MTARRHEHRAPTTAGAATRGRRLSSSNRASFTAALAAPSLEPFQRLGDTDHTTGLSLGLVLCRDWPRRWTAPSPVTLTPEDTPGGGPTMVLSLPFTERAEHPGGTQSLGGA